MTKGSKAPQAAGVIHTDFEQGFIRDHFDVMETLNRVLEGMLAAIREYAADALALLGTRAAPLDLAFRCAIVHSDTMENDLVGDDSHVRRAGLSRPLQQLRNVVFV